MTDAVLDNQKFDSALDVLNNELEPEVSLLGPGANYLKTVAKGLLYKVILSFLQCERIF